MMIVLSQQEEEIIKKHTVNHEAAKLLIHYFSEQEKHVYSREPIYNLIYFPGTNDLDLCIKELSAEFNENELRQYSHIYEEGIVFDIL